jgi:NhaA family Na+:H+ antiporter
MRHAPHDDPVVPARARSAAALIVEHSLLLPAGAVIALLWSNVGAASYGRLAHALEFPVNHVGMAFFFALAAKEVVEAVAPGGALQSWRRAALPVTAAIGGMAGPALIYLAVIWLRGAPALARGWAIPCATDIAFSYLVARTIYRQHPAIPFLLLLAIADDAFGLIILALFFPVGDLRLAAGAALLLAGVGVAWGLRRWRVRSFWPYVIAGGGLSWTALFLGGLHPALALVPIMPFLPHAARDPGLFVPAPEHARDPLSAFGQWWEHPVQGVLFLFGLVNAGVPLGAVGAGTWAVLTAVLVGKPLGIGVATIVAVWCGLELPHRLARRDVFVVGCAAAIGFTVALFFASAAFPAGPLLDQTRMGALLSVSGGALAIGVAAALRVGRFTSTAAARP